MTADEEATASELRSRIMQLEASLSELRTQLRELSTWYALDSDADLDELKRAEGLVVRLETTILELEERKVRLHSNAFVEAALLPTRQRLASNRTAWAKTWAGWARKKAAEAHRRAEQCRVAGMTDDAAREFAIKGRYERIAALAAAHGAAADPGPCPRAE